MSDSDSSSSSSSAVIATLEALRRSQNQLPPSGKRPDPSDDDSDGQDLLQTLEKLRQSRGGPHGEDSDLTSSSLSSSHIALAERLESLRMSQAEFSLSADSNKALYDHINVKGTSEEGFVDIPSMASTSTPVSESFEPSSAGVLFGESEDAVTQTDDVDVSQNDLILADPIRWSHLIDGISTLQHGQWLAHDCIDRFLLQHWYKCGAEAAVYWVPIEICNNCVLSDGIHEDEIKYLRDLLLLPTGSLKVKPIVFAVHQRETQHYFAVAFDYEHRSAYMWGRLFDSIQAGLEVHKSPEQWQGQILWSKLALLFGWQVSAKPVSWRGRNWYQNGRDCGATASAIVMLIARRGLPLSADMWPQMPELGCAHDTRLRMLKALITGVTASYRLWLLLKDLTQGALWSIPGDVGIEMMERGLYPTHLNIENRLVVEGRACVQCKSRRKKMKHDKQIDHSTTEEEVVVEEGEEDVEKAPLPVYLTPVHGDTPYPGALTPAAKKASKLLASARCRYTMPPRAPKTELGTLVPVPFQLLPRRLRFNFDDYTSGPSLEDHKEILNEYGKIPSNPLPCNYRPTERSIGELWKDWGFRTEPECLLMFRNDTPQAVAEHFLPLQWELSELPDDPLKDCVRMGMADMLAYAPDQGSNRSINAFVGGVRKDGDLIVFDPALDARPIMANDFTFTVDIDSIIINAHTLHVRGPVEVDVLPFCGKEPPMPKSNHTFAEILMPRSQAEIDADPARRTSWYSNRLSIASLPHTFFGKIGVFNIIIVFPRMKHTNPISRKSPTLLPWEMHAMFLGEVVHPAIIAIEDEEMLAYKDYNINEWYWKASTTSRFSGSRKSVTVTRMEELQVTMREIIAMRTDSNDKDLSMFASFFFVMEAKGIKHQTVCVVGKGEKDPYTLLRENMPYLDFEKLQERENGQLLMDIGMGFHPNPRDGEHVVCLWDLERVVSSYESAGMMAPNVHRLNTMHRYGGCQAEMKQIYAGLVHLCFRSTYGLHYEPVRRVRGGHITLCEDRDAYHTSSKFFSATNDYAKQLKSAGEKKHSYGAREELRGSGRAVREVLGGMEKLVSGIRSFWCLTGVLKSTLKMRDYIAARPMICVPVKIFFEFQRRRMLDLLETQRQVARMRPSNYGTTTTLIMHLIRSVCHAPMVTLPHLNRALTDLNYRRVSERFGMFFIHGLQLEAGFIDGIHCSDDEDCQRYYGKEMRRYRKKVGKHIHHAIDTPTVDLAVYPLGTKPTWEAWKAGMFNNPKLLVRSFVYDESWAKALDEEVAGLFIRFTREYLSTLREDALRGEAPPIDTLEDAMSVWTIRIMGETVVSSGFQPCNHGLEGAFQGARHSSFRDQMSHFFPNNSAELLQSAYLPFVKYGYLRFYHQVQTTDRAATVEKGLTEIFERLQILPVVNTGKVLWKSSKEQGILFWANSTYFKLEEIGPKHRFVQRERGPKVKAPMSDIIRNLMRLNDETVPDIAVLARENRERAQGEKAKRQKEKNVARRSAKGNRGRKPPPPRARGPMQPKEVAGTEGSEDEHAVQHLDGGKRVTRANAQEQEHDEPQWTVLHPASDSDSGNDATGVQSAGSDADEASGEGDDSQEDEQFDPEAARDDWGGDESE